MADHDPKYRRDPYVGRPRTRREFLVFTAFGVVVLAGCDVGGGDGDEAGTTSASATTAGGPAGGIVIGTPGDFPTLFRNLEQVPAAVSIYDAIFEYLVKSDPRQPEKGPQPQLAVSWKPIGETTWEFKLREGVKFHNGEDWDAEAAKINLDTVVSIKPPSPFAGRIAQFARAEVKDKYTLLIHSKERWATAPLGLSEIQMGAPGHLKEVGAQEFAQDPIGTGRFKLAEWKRGEFVRLEPNPAYWGKKASVDRLVFRGIPDTASRVAALLAGEIDIAQDLNINDVDAAKKEGFSVLSSPIAQGVAMTPYIVDATKDGHPTADPRVRRAMNHAIDRQGIIDSVLQGFGSLMQGQVTGPDAFGFDPTISEFEYDPAKARELLADAGFADGVDLGTFYVGVPGQFHNQIEFAQVVLAQLAEVGIKLKLQSIEYQTFLRRALQEHNLNYWHQGGWQYYPVMDASFALQWYSTPHHDLIRTGLGDAHYDEVFAASEQELDSEKRKKLLQECQQILHEKAAAVTLWQHVQIFGVNKRVKGFTPTPDGVIHWDTVSVTA